MLEPGTLGTEVTVLGGSLQADGWLPMGAAGGWRFEQGSLVVDRLSLYGHGRSVSPYIDAWARRRFHLLFEGIGEPRLELEAAPAAGASAGEALRQAIDLEAVTLPATFLWTGSGWQAETAEAPRVAGATVRIEWYRTAGLEGAVPFDRDPDLRLQLQALGYLD